jgi:opacity protein-like surface antigen
VFGARDEHYESGRIAVQGAGGVEVHLWRGLYATGEYKYTWSDQRFEISQGRASMIAQTHHVIGGLAYHFHR